MGATKYRSTDGRAGLAGTAETRSYYEAAGWLPADDGTLSDMLLWGSPLRGPIRDGSHRLRRQRVIETLATAGPGVNLLECGCGGNPAVDLLDGCRHYTGLDFSSQGLAAARARLGAGPVPFRLLEGDMCALPFRDGSFDAVYSSNALYHIVDPTAQGAALREMARVTRPGGVVVLILSNPRALLFPIHTLRRLAADAPLLGPMLQRLRPRPPIPYNPRPSRWMRRVLEGFGDVEVIGYTMPSVWFNKTVGEGRGPGRLAWTWIGWLEREHPRLTAKLGCYVQVTLRRR